MAVQGWQIICDSFSIPLVQKLVEAGTSLFHLKAHSRNSGVSADTQKAEFDDGTKDNLFSFQSSLGGGIGRMILHD